eukprot:COSAG02_NODE_29765_length_563_cov_1.116379_1_plen_69_part_01
MALQDLREAIESDMKDQQEAMDALMDMLEKTITEEVRTACCSISVPLWLLSLTTSVSCRTLTSSWKGRT